MKKYLIAIITLPLCFSFNYTQAQKVEESKVVIVKKTIDDKGKVIEERIEKSGKEADEYIKTNVEIDIEKDVTVIKKDVEKEVTVELNDKNGKMEKTIQIRLKDAEGGEKIMEWEGDDEANMPEEMKSQMKDVEIVIEKSEGNDREIKMEKVIKIKGDKKSSKNEDIEIRIKGNDGEEKIMKWNGEGEMPKEMQQYMENEDVEIISKDSDKEVHIIRRSGSENHQEMEWKEKGHLPEEIKEKLEKEGVKIDGENIFIFKSDGTNLEKDHDVIILKKGDKIEWTSDENNKDEDIIIKNKDGNIQFRSKDGAHIEIHEDKEHNEEIHEIEKHSMSMDIGKPRLGVMIENSVEGVKILEVIAGSAADKAGIKAGDVIYQVGKRNVGSDLQLTDSLKAIKAGESVKIKLLRSGSKISIKATL